MKPLFSLAFLLLINSISLTAQNQVIKIPLKIEAGKVFPGFVRGVTLNFDENEIVTDTPTGETIKIKRSSEKKDTFTVTIKKNIQSSSSLLESFEVGVDDQKKFTQKLLLQNQKPLPLEFIFISERKPERKLDVFYVKANYSLGGLFQSKGCNIPFSLFDLIPDGNLSNDFRQGSNLGIDRNGDGKIYGKGEWLFSDSIVDLCGKNYLISKIAQDRSYLSLKQTNLQNVKLFQESPKFNFNFVNSKNLSSESLKGKPYLVDFWATWCSACLAKMPEVKQLEGKLPIIYFNTDTISRKTDALNLIEKLNIKETSVLKFSTGADNFYKSYQRVYPGLPFYVLIDGEGRFRYGGGGGEDLKELKFELKNLGIN